MARGRSPWLLRACWALGGAEFGKGVAGIGAGAGNFPFFHRRSLRFHRFSGFLLDLQRGFLYFLRVAVSFVCGTGVEGLRYASAVRILR